MKKGITGLVFAMTFMVIFVMPAMVSAELQFTTPSNVRILQTNNQRIIAFDFSNFYTQTDCGVEHSFNFDSTSSHDINGGIINNTGTWEFTGSQASYCHITSSNALSVAFTCTIPMTDRVCTDEIDGSGFDVSIKATQNYVGCVVRGFLGWWNGIYDEGYSYCDGTKIMECHNNAFTVKEDCSIWSASSTCTAGGYNSQAYCRATCTWNENPVLGVKTGHNGNVGCFYKGDPTGITTLAQASSTLTDSGLYVCTREGIWQKVIDTPCWPYNPTITYINPDGLGFRFGSGSFTGPMTGRTFWNEYYGSTFAPLETSISGPGADYQIICGKFVVNGETVGGCKNMKTGEVIWTLKEPGEIAPNPPNPSPWLHFSVTDAVNGFMANLNSFIDNARAAICNVLPVC
jgi:hypothetical protein